MVFNSISSLLVVMGLFCLWVGILTYMTVGIHRHYNRLFTGGDGKTLREVLEHLLEGNNLQKKQIETLSSQIRAIEGAMQCHIAHIGVVRFNPFSDTGGSQSFTVAFLDDHKNGIVMTSLYARTGNRWYIKQVKVGKGEELELSKEELSAIQEAMKKHTYEKGTP